MATTYYVRTLNLLEPTQQPFGTYPNFVSNELVYYEPSSIFYLYAGINTLGQVIGKLSTGTTPPNYNYNAGIVTPEFPFSSLTGLDGTRNCISLVGKPPTYSFELESWFARGWSFLDQPSFNQQLAEYFERNKPSTFLHPNTWKDQGHINMYVVNILLESGTTASNTIYTVGNDPNCDYTLVI